MPRPHMRPPAALLAWVEHTLGSSARVVGCERLTGGLTSLVHGLRVQRTGYGEEYVLRWWMPHSQWEQWIARTVPSEIDVLAKLETSGIPAPKAVAWTTDTALGGPAVLMTRVPGNVHLVPRDRDRWL